jgi:hypothetical protein
VATDKDILTGALSRMDSYATSLPIAWPGVNFTPPQSGMWFEVRHFPNEPNSFGYGDDAKQDFRGFLQVSVFGRPGGGIVGLTEEAEGIVAHFPKGQTIGPAVVRQRPYVSPAIYEDNFIQIPVTIPYRGIV